MAQTKANRPSRPDKLAQALKQNMARRKEAAKRDSKLADKRSGHASADDAA